MQFKHKANGYHSFSFSGILVGFLPTMAPYLRGSMTRRQCWFILMLPEYVLSTTIIGVVVPVFVVVVLYGIILFRALKKVRELKKATSRTNGTETVNQIRYYRGSSANLSIDETHDTDMSLRYQSKKDTCCFCWKSNSPSENDPIKTITTPRSRQPSKWKAIIIVLFTTGSFIITWVPYFIASTMVVYCDHEHNQNFCKGLIVAVASPLAILGFSNSLLNPFIYACWHNGFRTNSIRILSKRFEQMTCCRWCFRKADENITSPRAINLTSTTNMSSLSPLASPSTTSDNTMSTLDESN